jgi:DNA-binding NarL/FixJ family response regulator
MSELARTKAAIASTNASTIHSLVSQGKWAEACVKINRQADLHADLAAEIAVEAFRSGMTQKRIAALLGVSPGTLRGLKGEASRV